MRAGGDQLLGQPQVVVQRVEPLGGIRHVAGVAEGAFDEAAGVAGRPDGGQHLAHVVEGVEDAEDVDAAPAGLSHEPLAHHVGIRGVADRVAAPQQHLQAHVRRRRADALKALPRILVQEPQCDIEGGPAPALQAQQLRHAVGVAARPGDQVDGAHPRRQDRLVGVTQRRVGHQHIVRLAHPAGEAVRAQPGEMLAGSFRRWARWHRRELRDGIGDGGHRSVGTVE